MRLAFSKEKQILISVLTSLGFRLFCSTHFKEYRTENINKIDINNVRMIAKYIVTVIVYLPNNRDYNHSRFEFLYYLVVILNFRKNLNQKKKKISIE